MKSLVVICVLSTFVLIGCVTQKGTKEDYFGYNNSPTIPEVTEKPLTSSKPKRSPMPLDTTASLADDSKAVWVNPLSDDDDPQEDYVDDTSPQNTVVVGYQPYSSPQFVPVIVPWWDSYSGWIGGCYARPVVVMRYRNWYWGWNSYCDWYSPYYDYHPWYGGNFSYYRPRYYGWNYRYWRPWHHYPIYTYGHTAHATPRKPNTVRSWGPTRGEPSNSGSGGPRGSSVTPTPVSSTSPAIRNERGQNSGSSPSLQTNSGTSTTTIPTIRNNRGNSTASPLQTGNQPLHRSETTPAFHIPKSTTTTVPSGSLQRLERTVQEITTQLKSDPRSSTIPTSGSVSSRADRSSSQATPNANAGPKNTSSQGTTPSNSSSSNSPRGTRKP